METQRDRMKTYTVEEGDTLSGIAEKFYGSASEENIKKLFEANRNVPGVGPTADDLKFEVEPFDADGRGQPVVLSIPDDDDGDDDRSRATGP